MTTTRIPIDPPLRSTYDVFVNTLSRAIAEKLSEDSGDEEHERYLKALELQTKAPKSELTTEIQYAVYLRSGLFDEENYSDAEVARIIIDLAMDHAIEALKVALSVERSLNSRLNSVGFLGSGSRGRFHGVYRVLLLGPVCRSR